MKYIPIDKDAFYRAYIVEGKSWEELEALFGVSYTTLRRRAKEFGFSRSQEQIQERMKKTSLERYGCEHACMSEEAIQKRKQTCLEKYGAEWVLGSSLVRERIKRTCLEKYGEDNVLKLDWVREKVKNTCMERYGEPYALSAPENQEKAKKGCLEKHGVEYYCMLPEFVPKAQATCMEHYGVKSWRQLFSTPLSLEVLSSKKKMEEFILLQEDRTSGRLAQKLGCEKATFLKKAHQYGLYSLLDHWRSKEEEEIVAFLKENEVECDLNNRKLIFPYEIDIYNPEISIGIEFNGLYWHRASRLGVDYHQKKSLKAEQKGIFLFHIFEHEWYKKESREKIKNLLLYFFGKSSFIYSLEGMVFSEISTEEAKKFVEDNSLFSSDFEEAVGLLFENELICCVGFCQNQIKAIAYKPRTKVINGEKFLFEKIFEKVRSPLWWEVDLGKFPSSLFTSWGFEEKQTLPPNPIPIEVLGEIGERLLEQNSLFEVYDCGNKVWTYKR